MANKDRYNAVKYRYKDKIKLETLNRYKNGEIKCAICGFGDIRALVLDHINNDGNEQRKKYKIKSNGFQTYEILKRLNWPDGLQILCANCNMIKEQNRHIKKRLENKFYARDNNTIQLYSSILPITDFTESSKNESDCISQKKW